MGEQMNVLSGSVSNINEYSPKTSTSFRPDSERDRKRKKKRKKSKRSKEKYGSKRDKTNLRN
jgi:hypothetical protein